MIAAFVPDGPAKLNNDINIGMFFVHLPSCIFLQVIHLHLPCFILQKNAGSESA